MLAAAAPSSLPARHARARGPVRLRLWLPLTPLAWLLAPLALLFAPFVWLGIPRDRRPANPYTAAIALGAVLVSLGGTIVDVDTRDARILIRVF